MVNQRVSPDQAYEYVKAQADLFNVKLTEKEIQAFALTLDVDGSQLLGALQQLRDQIYNFVLYQKAQEKAKLSGFFEDLEKQIATSDKELVDNFNLGVQQIKIQSDQLGHSWKTIKSVSWTPTDQPKVNVIVFTLSPKTQRRIMSIIALLMLSPIIFNFCGVLTAKSQRFFHQSITPTQEQKNEYETLNRNS